MCGSMLILLLFSCLCSASLLDEEPFSPLGGIFESGLDANGHFETDIPPGSSVSVTLSNGMVSIVASEKKGLKEVHHGDGSFFSEESSSASSFSQSFSVPAGTEPSHVHASLRGGVRLSIDVSPPLMSEENAVASSRGPVNIPVVLDD